MVLSTLLSSVVTAKCACIRNTNIRFFSNVCMQIKLVNILTYVQILSYKNGITISKTYNNTQHIQFASIMPVL